MNSNNMNRIFLFLLLFSGHSLLAQKAAKPNVVFIFADDLGYGDIGAYGQQKIETPNLDRLSKMGVVFTQFYAGSTVCAPSRSFFSTKLTPGIRTGLCCREKRGPIKR